MYERFTDRARKVMQLANQEAQRFNHAYLGTEHILLGLVKEGAGVAATVLNSLGIDLQRLRREVEKIARHGPSGGRVPTGQLPHSPSAKRAIAHAIEETHNLSHNYVGTEHLLLGLLWEEDGNASAILMNLNVTFKEVRRKVMRILGDTRPLPEVSETSPLTDGQRQLVRELIQQLTEQKETLVAEEDFVQAAKCRDKAEALSRLLAWYEWFQEHP